MASPQPFYDVFGVQRLPQNGDVVRPRRGVFAIARGGDYVLVVRPAVMPEILELPGGGVRNGETDEVALRREWAEEVSRPFALTDAPLATHTQQRGFFSYDDRDYYLYDQNFFLYDVPAPTDPTESWINSEKGTVLWVARNEIMGLPLIAAHRLAIDALTRQGSF